MMLVRFTHCINSLVLQAASSDDESEDDSSEESDEEPQKKKSKVSDIFHLYKLVFYLVRGLNSCV